MHLPVGRRRAAPVGRGGEQQGGQCEQREECPHSRTAYRVLSVSGNRETAGARCGIMSPWISTPPRASGRPPPATPASTGGSSSAVKTTGIYCRPDLPGADAEAGERHLLSVRGGGAGGGLPAVPALPAGDGARSGGVARHLEHGDAGAGADREGRRWTASASRRSPIGSASASGSCGGCSGSTSAPRRSPWRRRAGCCSPSS